MTMKLGRTSLRTPLDVNYVSRNTVDDGRLVSGLVSPAMVAVGTEGYLCRGREHGATAQALMDACIMERKRMGSIYVEDDSVVPAVPAGYYAIEDFTYTKPSGAPYMRPWRVQLTSTPMPLVVRQAENDNSGGADTADATADEGFYVAYTPTTGDDVLLRPALVAGAEKLNLPAGTYRVIARVWQTTNSSALFRFGIRSGADALLVDGAQVAIGTANAWVDLDLGLMTVPQANDRSNWYSIKVQGVAGQLGQIRIDRIIIAPA